MAVQLKNLLYLCIILTKTVYLQDKTDNPQKATLQNASTPHEKRNSSWSFAKNIVISPSNYTLYTIMKKTFFGAILLATFLLLLSGHNERVFTIYMIGDSTMANKNLTGGNPERGWGFVLPGFFDEKVYIENHAKNGRSTKSFIDEGRWDKVRDKIKKGDYVFIQFGHNDEKEDEKRHTEPGSTFDANLMRFINETRERGGHPVLFNSIVRRNFVDGILTDTHGEYREAPRRVAEAAGVPFIDMNTLTHNWVESLGDEASKAYFMWVEANTLACCPKGKEDNTHLNVKGAKVVAAMAVNALAEAIPELKPYIRHYDIVVAQDGSGDVFTIQEAINLVPDYRKEQETRILVRAGTYREKLIVPTSKQGISLIGQGEVIITGNDYAQKPNSMGEEMGTSGSATRYLYGDNFYAENITFRNEAGAVGQAVALLADNDRAIFYRCRFLGYQDTLYPHGKHRDIRQYYKECYIEGTVDFIFGWATAYFEDCTLHSKAQGYIAAPATRQETPYGFVFSRCHLTADEGVTKVYLGRPWREYGQAIYLHCNMKDHIAPEGWRVWHNKKQLDTPTMGEYSSTGTGAATNSRVKWAENIKDDSAYTLLKVLAGTDNWDAAAVWAQKREK